MKMTSCALLLALATTTFAAKEPVVSGDYLEVRSCDVYTGYCFANSEMNLAGKEATLLWSIRDGEWKGTKVGGLNVIAVVSTKETLGDQSFEPRAGKAVLIVDARADSAQREALADFARAMAGRLTAQVVDVKSAPIEAKLATCTKLGCASVKAGDLVEISTRCLGNQHDVCGNEETYYPPLTKVDGAYPVFADHASFTAKDLGVTWQIAGKRSAFIATFSTSPVATAPQVALVR